MADYYDTANQEVGKNSAALLAAIAAQGSAGKAAFDQAQQQINASKQQALQAALQTAAQRNTPQAMNAVTTSAVSQPFDRQLNDLSAASASRQAANAATQSRSQAYLSSVQAALPAMRNQMNMRVAGLQQQAAEHAAARAQAEQDRQQARQDRLDAKAERAAKQNDLTDSQLKIRLQGAGEGLLPKLANLVNPDIYGPMAQDSLDNLSAGMAAGDAGTLPGIIAKAKAGSASPEAAARQAGQNAGVDMNRVLGLFPPSNDTKQQFNRDSVANKAANLADPERANDTAIGKSVGLSEKSVRDARGSIEYKTVAQLVQAGLQNGKDPQQIIDDIKGAKKGSPLYEAFHSYPKRSVTAFYDSLPPAVVKGLIF